MDYKDFLPSLLKLSPALLGTGLLIYYLFKTGLKHFENEAKKREDFFIKELEKKDLIIKVNSEQYQKVIHEKDEELKSVNKNFVAVMQKFIEVTEKNNLIIANLKEVIVAMQNRT
jgi:hypothetical protein